MKKINLLFIATAIISISFHKSSLASNEIDCPEGSSEGSLCWKCGDNCTARLDTSGKMTVAGTGKMYDYVWNWNNRPWVEKLKDITSLVVEDGIENIGWNAFYDTAIAKATLADTVEYIDVGGLGNTGVQEVIIGENSSLNSLKGSNGAGIYGIDSLNVFCKGDADKCRAKQNLFAEINIEATFDYYTYFDSDGNYAEYGKNGLSIYSDENKSRLIKTYDSNGKLIKSWVYGDNGQVLVYDSAGNLSSMTKSGKFSSTEAAAATKPTGNTVSITW